jgi:hypothetical protein
MWKLNTLGRFMVDLKEAVGRSSDKTKLALNGGSGLRLPMEP